MLSQGQQVSLFHLDQAVSLWPNSARLAQFTDVVVHENGHKLLNTMGLRRSSMAVNSGGPFLRQFGEHRLLTLDFGEEFRVHRFGFHGFDAHTDHLFHDKGRGCDSQ